MTWVTLALQSHSQKVDYPHYSELDMQEWPSDFDILFWLTPDDFIHLDRGDLDHSCRAISMYIFQFCCMMHDNSTFTSKGFYIQGLRHSCSIDNKEYPLIDTYKLLACCTFYSCTVQENCSELVV